MYERWAAQVHTLVCVITALVPRCRMASVGGITPGLQVPVANIQQKRELGTLSSGFQGLKYPSPFSLQ